MRKIISTIFIVAIIIAFYSEVIFRVIQEQKKIEIQKAKIEASTQLLDKLYLNSPVTSHNQNTSGYLLKKRRGVNYFLSGWPEK